MLAGINLIVEEGSRVDIGPSGKSMTIEDAHVQPRHFHRRTSGRDLPRASLDP